MINEFTLVSSIQDMPQFELCSPCYIDRLAIMQSTPYSFYNDWYQSDLEYVYQECDREGETAIPSSVVVVSEDSAASICVSDDFHSVASGHESCETIGRASHISPVALYNLNPAIYDCSNITIGTKLCLPLTCATMLDFSENDNCTVLETANDLDSGALRRYNPWINFECNNLKAAGDAFGWVLCAAPQNGGTNYTGAGSQFGDTTTPDTGSDYTTYAVDPPGNASVALGTSTECGRWHVAESDDTCATICMSADINIDLLLSANPSLNVESAGCAANVFEGVAYCTGPTYEWADSQGDGEQ